MTRKFRWGPVLAASYFAGAWIGLWQFSALGQERVSGTERVAKTQVTRIDGSGILAAIEPNTEPGTPGGFEIDGNQLSGDASSLGFDPALADGDDWAQGTSHDGVVDPVDDNLSTFFTDCNWGRRGDRGDATQFGCCSNKNDDLIGEDDEPWNWDGTGGNPQKDDITNVYIHRRAVCRGTDGLPTTQECDDDGDCTTTGECDNWIFAALETRAVNGDRHVDFEINQAGVKLIDQNGTDLLDSDDLIEHGDSRCDDDAFEGQIIGNGTEGGRTSGDIVATMDYAQGGVNPQLSVRIWEGTAFGEPIAAIPGVEVFGIVNGADIATGSWPGFAKNGAEVPSTVAALQFIEIGINQSKLELDFPDICLANATVMAKTRSSDSFTAELKDFALFRFPVEPVPEVMCTDDEVCEDEPADLCAAPATDDSGSFPGIAPYTIVWKDDSGATLKTCTGLSETQDCCLFPQFFSPADLLDDGTYTATIIDSRPCEGGSCDSVLVVNENPTADAGEDEADCREATTDPSIGGSPTASGGTAGYTYLWSGTQEDCLSSKTVANPTFDLDCPTAGSGTYELCVLVTDSNGCFDDDCMTVTVHPEPVCTINALNVTVGDGVITITGAPVTGGTPPYTCDASFNAPSGWVDTGCTATVSTIVVTFTIPSPGTASPSAVLTVDIEDANGCETDCFADVGIDVGCTARPNQEVCEGDPDDLLSVVCADVEISSPSAVVEIFQFDGDIPCPSADALGSGAFTPVKVCAAVPNLGECCTDTDPPSGTPGVLTYCALTTESNGLTAVCDARTTIDPNPTADAGEDQAECREASTDPQIGGDPTASGGAGGFTYLWTGDRTDCLSSTTASNPTFDLDCAPADTYELCVLVTDSKGCEDEDCVDVTVHPEPTADAGDDISDCFDDFTSDPAVGGSPTASGGTAGYTYLWTGDRTDCLSSTTTSNPTFDVSCAGAGEYELCVLVTDSKGCVDDDCMVLTVHPEPTCTVDPPAAEICSTQTQQFCAVPAGGTPGYTFSWTGPNSFSSNAECITVSDAGTYTVTVTDAHGCTHDCDGVLTVIPCGQACSPGFWKNNFDEWCLTDFNPGEPTANMCGGPATLWKDAFGLTSCPGDPGDTSVSGNFNTLTLLESLKSGGNNQTLFHCGAALLSSNIMGFPLEQSEVVDAIQDACDTTISWNAAFVICRDANAVENDPNGCCPFSPPNNPECPLPGALGLRAPDVRMLEVKSPTGR